MEGNEHIKGNTKIAEKLKMVLNQAGIPLVDEKLLLKGLLDNQLIIQDKDNINNDVKYKQYKTNLTDFTQSENDFIDAYNALTRSSPLPNLSKNDHSKIGNYSRDNNIEYKSNDPGNEEIIHILGDNTEIQTNSKKTPILNSENYKPKPINENKTNIKKPQAQDNVNNKQDNVENSNNINELEIKEDIPNNLSDIVDSTQKIIQQMKNEITSDINSIPEKSDTQSETEESMNESHFPSEKESSYSDTEEEDSANFTSDNKELSSSDKDSNYLPENRLPVQRTSSEDNENFEEAMDHVEDELEEFKQTNIKMLNSIAQSLQEQHGTIIASEMRKPREITDKTEDPNNNLFSAVDSFEEIYAQLSKDTRKQENIIIKQINSNESKNNLHIEKVTMQEPQYAQIYTKELVNLGHFKPSPPIKLIINEFTNNFISARLENAERLDNQESISSEELNKFSEDLGTNKIELQISSEEDKNNVLTNTGIKEINTPIEIKTSPELNYNEENKNKETIISTQNKDSIPNTDNINLNNENFIESNNNIASELIHSERENSNNKVRAKLPAPMNKSNIPKLIKTIQSNKQKTENKNMPKLIASKVPIRRASLKQYHAPTPPKSHFGNVQSGHVKQLQTKMFNDKEIKPTIQTQEIPEVKASTSTITKKKPAPAPPVHQNTLTDEDLEKKKNDHYFRETCRTEDEWTESDSEEPDIQFVNKDEETIPTIISMPQPVTVRQISGQLIDLARVRLSEGSPEVHFNVFFMLIFDIFYN